ncbi:DUF2806 domain-containing protein [Pseudomonas sp. BIC9C]|uniref:DUF2806 domain-containing protein n=1 Tax=Pseudomonas sp. BIC9C TaxID=3078458 RepID=UPI002AD5747F|nr:DUF2806 domain-containing protein [Pseudomonas sp. BIC9C]
MGWPGEQLVSRLIETLSEKGIGNLLRPGQIKREGLANITVDRAKALVGAQTEREIEEIRSGKKDISEFSLELTFAKSGRAHSNVDTRIDPVVDVESLRLIGESRILSDAIRREVNTASTILYAEEILREDSSEPPEDKVDEDWLFRWRDCAGEVSGEDLQILWGRVLAGEVKSPGTYSLRCLEFLRNLSQSEAKLIEVMCSLAISDFIWRPDKNKYQLPLSFKQLLELEELGVIGGVTGGLSLDLHDSDEEGSEWLALIISNGKCLIVNHSDKKVNLRISAYAITKLGMQLLSLGSFKPNLDYLEAMGKSFIGSGFKVKVADVAEATPEYTSWVNAVDLK